MLKNCVLGHPFLGPLRRFYIKSPQDHPVPQLVCQLFFRQNFFFARARIFIPESASGKQKKKSCHPKQFFFFFEKGGFFLVDFFFRGWRGGIGSVSIS